LTRARDIANFGDGIATADIDDGAVTAAKLFSGFANGVTSASTFRLTTDLSISGGSQTTITTNLEEDDSSSYAGVGSAVSESGGNFSFPETGIYLVDFYATFKKNGDERQFENYIYVTEDNSNYSLRAFGDAFIQQTGGANTHTSAQTSCLINVVDTANVKFQLRLFARISGGVARGNTGTNGTYVNVIRLGDT